MNEYLKLTIGGNEVVVTNPGELPISIDYNLENPEDFKQKPSAQALSIKVPATKLNSIAANQFENPGISDMTDEEIFRNNQPFRIEENGMDILSGKAILTKATHTDRPISYEYDLFGDNADWMMPLSELTFYDIVKHINFVFDKQTIIDSWAFDGTNEALPYVFAPVRYRGPIGGTHLVDGIPSPNDEDMAPIYMKPAISKYFILYWALKSKGFKIDSQFLDSSYFRRQVMPWTWGNFLTSDGTKLNVHQFRAKGMKNMYYSAPDGRKEIFWDLDVSNDSTDGMFDNNNDYQYDKPNKEMVWEYKSPDFGNLEATFSMQVSVNARLNGSTSEILLYVHWYKNGVQVSRSQLVKLGGTLIGGKSDIGVKEVFFSTAIAPGDKISAKIYLSTFGAKLGFASVDAEVLQYQLDYFRIPLGGQISFDNYTGFKKYKFMDYLRGLIDEFNLQIKTDPVNKVVVIEPTHGWAAGTNPLAKTPGYFVDDFIDWNGKEDLSKEWVMENYRDYDRELSFSYKNDNNDGVLKVVQDRHVIRLAAGKYVFPNRFKAGKSEYENRFFAATMHYEVDQWKGLGTGSNLSVAPQMIAMVPENIANTSNSESSNTFEPKSCFYKGLVTGVGAWKFDGTVMQQFPYMFSANYKPGGENDPVLSYSDENINGVRVQGLLKRFFLQRLAIMRNGQYYHTFFRLKNSDVVNNFHREYKSYHGQKWELIQIEGYRPLVRQSTGCLLRRWVPVSLADAESVFPSESSVMGDSQDGDFDLKYSRLKCLPTDIPT